MNWVKIATQISQSNRDWLKIMKKAGHQISKLIDDAVTEYRKKLKK